MHAGLATRTQGWTGESQLGGLIREYRGAAGLSQRELARVADVTLGMLRDLEQGRTLWPRWGSVRALAMALGLESGQHDQLILAWNADAGSRTPANIRRAEPGRQHGALHVAILGPLEVTRSGQPIDLGPARQRAVLGLLALRDSSSVRLAELTELFWRDQPPATAPTVVQGYISRLRRLLAPSREGAGGRPVVKWTPQGYRLQAGHDCQLDHAAFRQLARAGHDALALRQHSRACELYERALSLWRGGPLDDIELLREHPLFVELNIQRSEAVMQYAGAAAMTGAHGQVLPHLRDLCARECLNEQALARLMVTLAATGQRAAAIAEFEQLRLRLDRELGILPDEQVIRAYSQITAGAISGGTPDCKLRSGIRKG